jgi:putative ABC transport system permease protein
VTSWLLWNTLRRAPRRLALAALAVAFPVALLGATLLFVDVSARTMTRVALEPVQVEMRAVATSLDTDMTAISEQLAAVPGVRRVDRFAATDVVVGRPGRPERSTARLFAVDPAYLHDHPWVRVPDGSFGSGALLNQSLRGSSGLDSAGQVTIALPSAPSPLATVPVGGVVDLRTAYTWFAIPTGEVQGDIAVVPRAIVVDYDTFDRVVRPALIQSLGATTPVLNPGLQDLPPVDVETHISVSHTAYPTDPASAETWSTTLQHQLEARATGQIVVADNAVESLTAAKDDARNAKVLFLLLGIPGVLAAAALGLAAESALSEAHRREQALLRLRGATDGQLAWLGALETGVAGLLGAAVGVLVAALAVGAVTGQAVWTQLPGGRLAVSLSAAVLAGLAVVVVRVLRIRRAGRRAEVAANRRVLERGWSPTWRRARLDLLAIAVGVAILVVNQLTGGLRQGPVEGPPLALFLYVMLAPIVLWVGISLLAARGLLAGLTRWARPGAARPLTSWWATTLRWLGRRPARAGAALVLGVLAVSFGTEVLAFTATYETAKDADSQAAFGADLRLTPATENPATPPPAPELAGTSPVRFVPARVGSDRKTILTIDLASYGGAVIGRQEMLAGEGTAALAGDPTGVLVAPEIATGFAVGPGDILPVMLFPDDGEKSRNINLHVRGVFLSVPPTDPVAELVMGTGALPGFALPPPETYLARVASGLPVPEAAVALRDGPVGRSFQVTTRADRQRSEPRSLTALNLGGLGLLESVGAGLISAIGVAVLGAFVVMERRREFAVLRTIGAGPRRLLSGPAQEAALTVFGSLVLGIPIGLGLAALSVRILGLFFWLPPPLVTVPAAPLSIFVLLVVATAVLASGIALAAVNRVAPAATLREP